MNMTTFISIFIFTFTFLKVKHGPSPPRRFIKLIIVTFTFLLLTFTFQLRKINKRTTSCKEARLCFLRGRLLFRSQVLCNLIFLLNCAIGAFHVIMHRKIPRARFIFGIWWNHVFVRNPYIPVDSKDPSMDQMKQRKLVCFDFQWYVRCKIPNLKKDLSSQVGAGWLAY